MHICVLCISAPGPPGPKGVSKAFYCQPVLLFCNILRGQHIGQFHATASPFLNFFEIILVFHILRFGRQLGSQLGPKIGQKSSQEPSKPHQTSLLIFDCLSDQFLINFLKIFDPNIEQKSMKN